MRYLLAGVLVVAVAAALAATTMAARQQAAEKANLIGGVGPSGRRYEQIQLGMTQGQVEAILGGPRGCYDGKEHNEPPSMALPIGFDSGDGSHSGIWYFADCTVKVYFDRAGKADTKELEVGENVVDVTVPPPTLADRLSRAWQWACKLLY